MRATELLKENQEMATFERIARDFLPFVKQRLELEKLPKIEFLSKPLEDTFGRYHDGKVRVVVTRRHPIDVLRTLAHELVHWKQELDGKLHPESGETGSPEENEANAKAGVIMRDFDQANPELLSSVR
jgi:hypothetical protein